MEWRGSLAGCILTMVVFWAPGVTKAQWPWVPQPLAAPWRPPQYPAQTRLVPGAPAAPLGSSQSMLRPSMMGRLQTHGARVKTPIHRPPNTPRPSFLSSILPLTSLLDPFGLFSQDEEKEVRRGLLRKQGKAAITTTEVPPPIVYFPEGGNGACQDFAAGGGFNTYSFLSFLFSVANLIGHVANNVNNNLNNNNNNNNDNNNNLNNINSAESNSNVNNQNTVSIPPGMGRRRRHLEAAIMDQYKDSLRLKEEEEMTALVAMDFIRGLRSAMLTSDPSCALRNMCEVNRSAVARGDLADVIAEVFSLSLVEFYPRELPVGGGALLSAAAGGRRGQDCSSAHQRCSNVDWLHLSTFLDLEDFVFEIPPAVLKEDLGLPSLRSIFEVTSFTSGLDVLSDIRAPMM